MPETTPVTGPIINGRAVLWKDAAISLHQCLWCHNETPKHRDTATHKAEPFFIVRYFGIKEGPVGSGGRSAVAAWRSAYEALSTERS